MPDRIARVWTGSEWEVITSNSPSPNAVAVYQSASPSGPVTGQVWINSNTNVVNVWSGSAWVGTNIDASSIVTGTLPVARGGTGTTTSTGTGSVVLSNASTLSGLTTASALAVSNNFTVDTNTLHVDSVNNRVGIGTTSPSTPLHVVSTGTDSSTPSNSNSQLILQDSGGLAGNGGMILFSASQGGFAAIKGRITDGTSNTVGNLSFYNRSSVSASTLTENMRIDPAGRVTMPFQVAFSGHTGSFSSTVTGAPTHTSGINYGNNTVLAQTINVGGHWNLTTGRFTAPISGRYVFGVNAHKDANTAARDAIATLSVNGSYSEISEIFGNFGDGGATILLNLSANDWVEAGRSNAFTNVNRITFWGYLLG